MSIDNYAPGALDPANMGVLEHMTRPGSTSSDPIQVVAIEASSVDVSFSEDRHERKLLPVLHEVAFAPQGNRSFAANTSLLADGMKFKGRVSLEGPFNVSGAFVGNISQKEGLAVAVVVELSGVVNGDITAFDVSVKGITDGLIDAGRGEVLLHDSACVKGSIRYGRIKVNGADLNATLVRVDNSK